MQEDNWGLEELLGVESSIHLRTLNCTERVLSVIQIFIGGCHLHMQILLKVTLIVAYDAYLEA